MNRDRQSLIIIRKLHDDVDSLIVKRIITGNVKGTSIKRIRNHRYRANMLPTPLREKAMDVIDAAVEFAEKLNNKDDEAYSLGIKLNNSLKALAAEVDLIG